LLKQLLFGESISAILLSELIRRSPFARTLSPMSHRSGKSLGPSSSQASEIHKAEASWARAWSCGNSVGASAEIQSLLAETAART